MAFDFPNSPATGTVQTGPNGAQWRWDGTKWLANAAWQTASLVVSDTPPANPVVGALWFDSVGLGTYTWFNDGTSSQWTPVVNQSGLVDAPSDGQYYVRRNAGWVNDALSPAVQNNTGRNLIHNGTFMIAQRGPGPTTVNAYCLDRWSIYAVTDTVSVSQTAFTLGTGPDETAVYALGNTFTGSAAAAAYNTVYQPIEDVRRLSNRTVTVSFWASSPSGALKLGVQLTQQFGTGGSPSAAVPVLGQAVTLSSSYTRYSLTFTLPSVVGKTLGTNNNHCTQLFFWYSSGATNSAAAGGVGVQSGTVYIWGVQLEYGNVATPLAVRDPADELALCQRFYCTFATRYWNMYSYSNGLQTYVTYFCPVTMRAAPTLTVTSTSASNVTSVTAAGATPDGFQMYIICTATGGTATTLSNVTASADL